jgi:hypothetical protein
MTREGKVHEGIRLRISNIIDERGYKYLSGHSNQNLGLFSDRKSNETHFSDADILVLDGNNKVISIVEIKDKDVQPKEIIGIIGSTSICNKFIDKSGEYLFNNPTLYIVIKDETLNKVGSKKRPQMDLIKERLSIDLKGISKYKICSESEFKEVFNV